MILITFFFFENFEKLENMELILFDAYYFEFISYLEEKIKNLYWPDYIKSYKS
jgi:hypothetical protein